MNVPGRLGLSWLKTTLARLFALARWLTPPLLCLAVYWPGLRIWFLQDDFAWLSLRLDVSDLDSFVRAIFVPTRHGTFRPFSERGFFLLFSSLFGLNPLPFRIWVFLTEFVNLALLGSVATRLTGSKAAGFWAPVFWISNTVMVGVMTWSSAYMQVLCGLVLLLSFHFFLRYIETGERRYWRWQWVPFLFGFGVIETTMVYPALAAAYAGLCARKHFRGTWPLFLPSIAFAALHMLLVPKQRVGSYSMHFDFSILSSLWTYWRYVFERGSLSYDGRLPAWFAPAGTAVFTIVLAAYVLWMAVRKRWLPLFFLCWFVILLAPVLPLREHLSHYYLTLPTIGIACLGADAFAWAFRRPLPAALLWRAAAVTLAAAFLVFNIPHARATSKWWYERGYRVKMMMLGVQRARVLHPDSAILLVGVGDAQFWGGIVDGCFRAIGISDVYLESGTEKRVTPYTLLGNVEEHVLPPQIVARGLDRDQIVVYEVRERLVNITSLYRRAARFRLAEETPRRVDAGYPLTEYLFGPTWYERERHYRWMPKRATLRIHGPASAQQRLYMTGYRMKFPLAEGLLTLSVAVDGIALPPAKIVKGDAGFAVDFALPPQLVGKPEMEIALEVDRPFTDPRDGREMGLVFGVFEVK